MATPRTFRFEKWQLEAKTEAEYHAARQAQIEKEYSGLSQPILTRDQLFEMEDPEWVLTDFIQSGGLTILHGNPGSGKSLLAMDWAYALAHPHMNDWLGKPIAHTRKPMYLFTEGLSGLKKRTLAWEAERQTNAPDIVYVRDPVIMNPENGTSEMLSSLEKLYVDNQCDILFIDTLANTFGGNENQQQDANRYLQTIRRFQTYGPVVLVHHNKKDDDGYRGSTVFHGAVDTMVSVKMNDYGVVDIKITKQKDGDPFKGSMALKLKQHQIYGDDKDRTSVVLVRDQGMPVKAQTAKERTLLEYLESVGGEVELTKMVFDLAMDKANLKRDIARYSTMEVFSPGGNNPSLVRLLQAEAVEKL